MKVIIVEDETITSLFLENTLEILGYTVVGCYDNGTEVLNNLIYNCDVDLIFMDINISGKIDGIQLAQSIKENHNNIDIVFVTAYQDSETIQMTRLIQPLGYLIKPINQSHIEAMMLIVENKKSHKVQKLDDSEQLIGPYLYHMETKTLRKNGQIIELSVNEQKCLFTLINNLSSYVSCEQLMYTIWEEEKPASSLRELLFRLRKNYQKYLF